MPVDASVYAQFQPTDFGADIQRGLQMKQQRMQNQQLQTQIDTQKAMRDAYAANTNPDGTFNRQGYLSSIGKVNPQAAIETQKQWNEADKLGAETHSAQIKAADDKVSALLPNIEYIKSAPADQQPAIYAQVRGNLIRQGVISQQDAPEQFDPKWLDQQHGVILNTKAYVDQQNTQAQAAKAQGETAMQPVVAANKKAETAKIYNDIGDAGDKRLQALKDDLDPNKARGGNLAKSQSVINAADRLGAMFKQFPDYNIPKAQQTELVSAFGAILNGGSAPLQSQMEELVPKSAMGDANSLAAWVTNDPTGQQQQKFMQLLHESVGREREVADNQVKSAQVQRLSAHQLLQKTNAQGYASVLDAYGIKPENIKNGKYVPSGQGDDATATSGGLASNNKSSDLIKSANAGQKQPGISSSDAQALQWLKSTDPSDPVAFQIRAKLRAKGLLK